MKEVVSLEVNVGFGARMAGVLDEKVLVLGGMNIGFRHLNGVLVERKVWVGDGRTLCTCLPLTLSGVLGRAMLGYRTSGACMDGEHFG